MGVHRAKDARYSDVKYVEELAGPGLVNTMPPATLAAFRHRGRVADAPTSSAPAAHATLTEIVAAGIDLDAVTARLLDEGVPPSRRRRTSCSPASVGT